MYLFCLFFLSTRAIASPVSNHEEPNDSFEFGIGAEWYQYREPDFAKLQGSGVELDATYTYNWSHWFLKANAIVDFYNLMYSSNGTGSEDGIADYKQEFRGLFGKKL